ncbi:MAG: NAD-dependent deacetylase [Vicinamibacterales bacterium]
MSGTTDAADPLAAAAAVVAGRLRTAARITVLTGAGVSAASGVPTFRGHDGLWRRHRPEDLATPEAFARDPALVWEWYGWRRERIRACLPNAGHAVLAAWAARWAGLTLATQNVDGLHERAGTPDVLRLHGSLWHVRCGDACRRGRAPRPFDGVIRPDALPRCPFCGALDRPAVVWFGEPLDREILDRAAEAAAGSDVFLAVGTSAVVFPAAGLIPLAREGGAFVVEVNPDGSAFSDDADVAIRGGAEEVLPRLERAIAQPGSDPS